MSMKAYTIEHRARVPLETGKDEKHISALKMSKYLEIKKSNRKTCKLNKHAYVIMLNQYPKLIYESPPDCLPSSQRPSHQS